MPLLLIAAGAVTWIVVIAVVLVAAQRSDSIPEVPPTAAVAQPTLAASTATPSFTPTPTVTPSRTPTASATNTPLPTATLTSEPSATATETPLAAAQATTPTQGEIPTAGQDEVAAQGGVPADARSAAPEAAQTEPAPDAASASACTTPDGWQPYTVQADDTLFEFVLIATEAGVTTSVDDLMAANCLPDRLIVVGQVIYLPPGLFPTPAPPPTDPPTPDVAGTQAACIRPEGWQSYTVQQDDTLFAFVLGTREADQGETSVEALVTANCLQTTLLTVGQVIFLPPGAADNAPPSAPQPAVEPVTGPRTPLCPCTIVVPEGWRREQIAASIDTIPVAFSGADFLNATGSGAATPYDYANARPGGTSLEGFLFPGTYEVQNETTAEAFRDQLLAAFDASVSAQMRADASAQGISFYEALTMASVIQRESRAAATQKLIASLFYNRLRDGNRLGSTTGAQYALGVPGNWWPRINGSNMEVDSPYNTYTHPGLPPGPIDNPGLSAITAAVYPAETDYYYMAASCDGTGAHFSTTYEEHLATVNCQ
ncbi:endolytic transglycosylase MltG [Aggregatilinea lenta]|uniref:endolytic transglycosylase MltG n=1 Tax=Aggregatilinea lenta TaxID=913108 RepID=UPI000E5AD319|nr:endolytic transglycosylase MltG [Aggregatilinea lenta]